MSTTTTTSRPTGYGGRVTIPGVGRDIENVLLWRDIRITGAIFTAGTILYFLLEWSGYSLLTLVSNTLLAALALAFLWNNVARFTGKTSSTPAFTKPVNESDVKQLAQQLTIIFNKSLAFGNRLISGQEVILTGEVAIALYVIARVGRLFSSLGLVYTLFVLAFTLPKLYELRKEEIDGAVSQTYSQGHKVYHQNVKPYLSSIPRASGASSGVSSGATSGTTQPTAAGRAGGVTGDTATSSPSATLQEGLGARGGSGGSGYGSGGNQGIGSGNQGIGSGTGGGIGSTGGQGTFGGNTTGQGNTGYGSGSGQGGAPGFDSIRDTFNKPQTQSGYGGQSSYNEPSYQQGGSGQGAGGVFGQGTGGGSNQSYTEAARDTANIIGNKASDLGNQAYQNLPSGGGSRSNY